MGAQQCYAFLGFIGINVQTLANKRSVVKLRGSGYARRQNSDSERAQEEVEECLWFEDE